MSVAGIAAAPEQAVENSWRPMLRAAGVTGAAAVAGAVFSVIATKIFAAMLGPAEVAVLATLQQIRQAGVTGSTLNGQTALVQGASARSGLKRRQFLRTALVLMGAATLLLTVFALAAPGWIARSTGLGIERTGMVRWMVAPVALSCALVFLSAVLNASGQLGRLALVQMGSPVALAGLAYPVVRMVRNGHENALVWWLAFSIASAVSLALWSSAPAVAHGLRGGGSWWSAEAARGFLTISGAMLASGVVASVVLLAARGRILHQQGFAVTGQFDAAWAISMNHVSLVLASLQTYCLPALARTSDRTERNVHLSRMLTAAALAAAAVICAIAVVKPLVITALYSTAFGDATRYLRWTLVGDYLKVSSWVLSIPLLAAADMRWFLFADAGAYMFFAAGTAAAGQFRGAAEATAIGFVLMYGAHLSIAGTVLWRRYGFRPDRRTTLLWSAGLLAVLVASAQTWNMR